MQDNIFIFTVGDWSDDGHGKKEQYIVKMSHPAEAVYDAYDRLKEDYDIDLMSLCCDYDDPTLRGSEVRKLEACGVLFDLLDLDCYLDEDYQEFGIHMSVDMMFHLFFHAIGTQIDNFTYEEVKIPTLNGYWNDRLNGHYGYGVL